MLLVFWICVLLVVYPYLVYPIAIAAFGRFRARPLVASVEHPSSVSFIVAARNEGARITERVRELGRQLDQAEVDGQIIVVFDGAEGHVSLPKSVGNHSVDVITFERSQGKAAALSAGAKIARGEIIALADVRQRWEDGALRTLLENFRDPAVGAVSGELILTSSDGLHAGVGLYWRFEKWLRANEAKVDSVVGVTGAISAVRKSLFPPIPPGTVLDDVYWPLAVAMQGYRVIHDRQARAFDRLPARAQDEFRRKVRTLCGNFQLLQRLPTALLPGKNRICLQYISHKVLRLAVPWALGGVLITSAMIASPGFQGLFWAQIAAAGALALVVTTGIGSRSRTLSAGTSFAMLNLAAWIAFWLWLWGNAGKTWAPVRYDEDSLKLETAN